MIQCSIVPIDSFREAQSSLRELNSQSLVLFDVDGTITIPEEPALLPSNFSRFRHLFDEVAKALSFDQKVILKHLLIGRSSRLIESNVKTLIRRLQRNNIPTYALTSAFSGCLHDELGSFDKLRHQILEGLGIDFALNSLSLMDFEDCIPYQNTFPCLHDGIIYAAGFANGKAKVLESFLRRIPEVDRIVFFEDSLKHLDSIAAMLADQFPNTEFLGFHCCGKHRLPGNAVDEAYFRKFLKDLLIRMDTA